MHRLTLPLALAAVLFTAPVWAGQIDAKIGNAGQAAFDITGARISRQDGNLVFSIAVADLAGALKPVPTGKLAGASVYSYVWPTTLDSSVVGFDKAQGILALAVTVHPDFDDTPASDENGDGKADNDGDLWHSHWVVLGPDEACGKGALKVIDIPEGVSPKLPASWPGLPLLIDSPDLPPVLEGKTVTVTVPEIGLGDLAGVKFDGVTAGLRVNEQAHSPLLCVANVFDVASGNLSLPGIVTE